MVYAGLREGPGSRHVTNPDRAPAAQGVPASPGILVLAWRGVVLQQRLEVGFLLVLF
jgi:hypothetical protein